MMSQSLSIKKKASLVLLGTLVFIPALFATDRGTINSGETRIGLGIAAPSYMDTWTFEGNAGDRILVRVRTTSGSLDTVIYLYPPGSGSAEESVWNAVLSWQLEQTGLYTINIRDWSGSNSGNYNISFLKIPGVVSSSGDTDGGAIASGQTLSGAIDVASDLDAFQIYGNAGDRIIVRVRKTSGDLSPTIYLYPPDGGPAEQSVSNAVLSWQLEQTGLYTINIRDNFGSGSGNYNISFLKIPGTISSSGDPDGGAIASGQTLSGAINVASDMDAFQIYGNTGDRIIVTVTATSGDLSPTIYLYPPDGGPAEQSVWNAVLSWQLEQTGLYTINIRDNFGSGSGNYNISLSKIPSTVRTGLYNPYPSDGGLTGAYRTTVLRWQPVSGATGYDVYFGADAIQPLDKIADNSAATSLTTAVLQNNQVCYWYVIAHTAAGDITGPWWWFATTVDNVALSDFCPDFNGDGKDDILWRRTTTGSCLIQLMDGISTKGRCSIGGDLTWEVVGIDDFDNDGKDDILWRKTTTGSCLIQLMNGVSTISRGTIGGDLTWEVVGLGDFNYDNHTDILWRKTTTGSCLIQLMDGVSTIGRGTIGGDLTWEVVGIGDFDNDGKDDILWRRTTTGGCLIQLMNGTSTKGRGPIGGDLTWDVVGLGDFDNDLKTDILWRRNTTGSCLLQLMNGVSTKGRGTVGGDLTWEPYDLGDFNGDSKADILWRRNTTGNCLIQLMNGVSTISRGTIGGDLTWEAYRLGDFNGGGKADILWRKDTTGSCLIQLMNGVSTIGRGTVGGDLTWEPITP
jgi:hypothetical protein